MDILLFPSQSVCTPFRQPGFNFVYKDMVYVEWGWRETIPEDECPRFQFVPSLGELPPDSTPHRPRLIPRVRRLSLLLP